MTVRVTSWALAVASRAFLSRTCPRRQEAWVESPKHLSIYCVIFNVSPSVLAKVTGPSAGFLSSLGFGKRQKEGSEEGRNHSHRKYLVNGVQSGGEKVKGQLQSLVSTLWKPESMNRINMAEHMGN